LSCPTAGVTGGWGDKGLEMENRQSSETTSKNAHSPSRPVDLGRMGTSYFRKETATNGSIRANGRRISRTLAVVSLGDSRGAPWLPITMIYQLVTP